MSFMRDIESRLRPAKGSDIEKDIPFWEFLRLLGLIQRGTITSILSGIATLTILYSVL